MDIETPILSHPKKPKSVPLIASFTDDRNRLSYYHPILKQIESINTPLTTFIGLDYDDVGGFNINCRKITEFMIDAQMRNSFIRSDFSSGKLNGVDGSKIQSQDANDIRFDVFELIKQLSITKRGIGSRLAVREWIPHDIEVRTFIRSGELKYIDSCVHDGDITKDVRNVIGEDIGEIQSMANDIANVFQTFAWSVDFIKHKKTNKWYCIDMGLDGLYYDKETEQWVSISEHHNQENSPCEHISDMPSRAKITQ